MSDDVTRGAAIIGPRSGLCASCFSKLSAKQKGNLRKAMAKEIASTPAMPVAKPPATPVPKRATPRPSRSNIAAAKRQTPRPSRSSIPAAKRETPRPSRSNIAAAKRRTPRPDGRTTPRPSRGSIPAAQRRTPQPGSRRAEAESSSGSSVFLFVAAALGVAGIVVAVFLMSQGGDSPKVAKIDVPKPPETVVAVAAVKPTDEAHPDPAAAERLAEIRTMVTPTLDHYDDILEAVDQMLADFPHAAEAADATRLMDEVNRSHAKLADEALASALETAKNLEAAGQADTALSIVRSVRSRFRGSAWARSGGDAKIDAALARLEKARRASSGRLRTAVLPAAAGYVFGLRGEYLNGADIAKAKRVLRRIDPQVRFDWATGNPAPGVTGDNFSVRWTGQLLIPRDGSYAFEVHHDDVGSLTIGGKKIASGSMQSSGSADLKAGWVPFKFEFSEKAGEAVARVEWSGPGFDKRPLLPNELRTAARKGEMAEGAPVGTHVPGLRAEFFNGTTWSRSSMALRRVDPKVMFDWGAGSPGKGVNSDGFAARWGGEINVPSKGRYRFVGSCDDRANVIVDGKEIRSADGTIDGALDLEAGWKPLRIELYEGGGSAKIQLSWSGPGFETTAIGPGQLRTKAEKSDGLELAVVSSEGADDAAPEAKDAKPEPPKPTLAVGPLPGETGEPGAWAPGLVCSIATRKNPDVILGARIEHGIDFDFGNVAPNPNVPHDQFVFHFKGMLYFPMTGTYTLGGWIDDALELSLDGKPVLSWKKKQRKTQFEVRKAGAVPMEATYTEYGGRAFARLRWIMPNLRERSISPEYYLHKVPREGHKLPAMTLARGLKARYFSGDGAEPVATGVVDSPPHPDYAWPACTAVEGGSCTVKLSGKLLVPYSGKYDFKLDGGAKITIDGQSPKAQMELKQDYHDFEMEYVASSNAKPDIQWDFPGGEKPEFRRIEWRFYFHEHEGPTPTLKRSGLAPGLRGVLFAGIEPGKGQVILKRTDPIMAVTWDNKPPSPKIANRIPFSGAWQGSLLVPEDGKYTFRVRKDGGVRLIVGGQTVVEHWKDWHHTESGSLDLKAGKVPIQFQYYNKSGGCWFNVYWAGPNFPLRYLGRQGLFNKTWGVPTARVKVPDMEELVAARAAGGSGQTAVAAMDKGPLIRNGDFEAVDDATKFAASWRTHLWGVDGGRYSVRLDKTNVHGGDRALCIRGYGEGGLPGAFTTVTKALDYGLFEVSFWACADIEQTATVYFQFGDQPEQNFKVDEKWKRYSGKVTLRSVKATTVVLRLWTPSTGQRVWFDDVDVVRTNK